ncbi:tRNA uridine(34) 5-carboxymethylaminomethyl modification radical SAM/GNAT enzyme Elp3 [Candidatus Pacearchaeota archaeon]|nr:tRNA uridine(34) 5-carboxymethylaminomethyl modification radical SAM/GNAT enzyme Elp3 [Candidatus Pacearchaeota archaeon]
MKSPAENEIRKPTKTLAGVTPIAVMTYPKKCKHGTCLYCPSLDVPQSYTPKSPPVLRAERLKYDPLEQVKSRLKAYKLMHHPTDKIELIVMGGNFLDYPEKYKLDFIKACFDALNGKKSSSLEQAKKINEKAKHRCVALCIEGRPDTIVDNKNSIHELLNFGCTRFELGVQCLDDSIYKKVNRGHTIREVIQASRLLRDAGFKIGYHMMLGLPFSNKNKDLEMFKKLFSSQEFKPDQIKIYPCQVIQGASLVNLYKKGKYKPYNEKEIQEMVIKIMQLIPNYCRVMRIMREIPPEFLVAGTTRIDLRKDIEEEIRKRKLKINEIRFREIGFAFRDKMPKENISSKLKLRTTTYDASEGKEYFLEFVNKDNILFGLLRLRIKNQEAIVRELHVYGQSLELGKKASSILHQHRGLGKLLMKRAEEIAKKEKTKITKIKVISGVGVREYYRKLGYELEDNYMIKKF